MAERATSTYQRLLGLAGEKEAAWAEDLHRAVIAIDPSLIPAWSEHPYAELIAAGAASLKTLTTRIDRPDPGKTPLDALDAIAQVVAGGAAPAALITDLRERLHSAETPKDKSIIARVLAIAGDENLMAAQLEILTHDDPDLVAAAARLLGFGRFAPAIPALCGLVTPGHFVESPAAIWALGEIADPRAGRHLEQALADGFRPRDILVALGKIGRLESVPYVIAYLNAGQAPVRQGAHLSLAMILHARRDDHELIANLDRRLGAGLDRRLEEEPDLACRFHGLLCLARLGRRLDASRIRMLLGSAIDDRGLGAVSSFYHSQWQRK